MKFIVIIPIYNDADYLDKTLESFVNQSCRPNKLLLVNDNSTDDTQSIIDQYVLQYDFIDTIHNASKTCHQPGAKVINAFYKGFESLHDQFDLIGKFDADIVLPPNYFEKIISIFNSNAKVGIAGGNLYIEQNGAWIFENISKKTKVRGPIKLYREQCFSDIGGLKRSIGWDTVDELIAQFHGWEIQTDLDVKVKHLKPTGDSYTGDSKYKQGEAFYKMRYGFFLSTIAAIKLAFKKREMAHFMNTMQGYLKAKNNNAPFIVSKEEGKFIRSLRWNGIKNKLF